MEILAKYQGYITLGLTLLVGFEQVIANVPTVKANSTFQLICNLTDSLAKLFIKKEPTNA